MNKGGVNLPEFYDKLNPKDAIWVWWASVFQQAFCPEGDAELPDEGLPEDVSERDEPPSTDESE